MITSLMVCPLPGFGGLAMAAKKHSLMREGNNVNRKYLMQISDLVKPKYNSEPIIKGEGAESESELQEIDETLNVGQGSV